MADPAAPEAFSSVHTPSFPALLRELRASLLVTTFQAGRVILMRPQGKTLNTHFVAHLLRNVHVTGHVDIHEMAFAGSGIAAVAFKYSPAMLVPPAAKATKASSGGRGAEVAKARAIGASVRAKLAALRGAHGKAAVNKAASEPVMASTIVGGNSAIYDVSCGSCTISGSNNLVQFPDASLPIDTIVGQDPRHTPLANHGGQSAGAPGHAQTAPVLTHLLFAGSPAIDTGLNPENFSYEQRGAGFERVIGPAADIGATEGSVASNIPVRSSGRGSWPRCRRWSARWASPCGGDDDPPEVRKRAPVRYPAARARGLISRKDCRPSGR